MSLGRIYPPFAQPGARFTPPRPKPSEEQLPSIDQFLDELPLIDDFLSTEPEPVIASQQPEEDETFADAPDEYLPPVRAIAADGWAEGAWQSYDWSSLASLNRQTPSTTMHAWGETDWPPHPTAVGNQQSGTPGPDEIADALDGIARRIRSGELVIDNLSGTPPEAAMAAALAVLLKMRG